MFQVEKSEWKIAATFFGLGLLGLWGVANGAEMEHLGAEIGRAASIIIFGTLTLALPISIIYFLVIAWYAIRRKLSD